MPGARCTRSLACENKMSTRASHHRYDRKHPAFPAQWFDDLYVLSLATRLSCHHHPRDAKHHRELDAYPGASGPHDFADASTPLVRGIHVPIATCSNLGDDGRRPPLPEQDGRIEPVICGQKQVLFWKYENFLLRLTLHTRRHPRDERNCVQP